jgi:Trp operon repressor
VISVEDWALIRRLVADGVPQRQVARDLGIGRATVARAVASFSTVAMASFSSVVDTAADRYRKTS